MFIRSGLFGGHVLKVRVERRSCLRGQDSQCSLYGCPHAGRLGCRNWLCWLGPYSPDSGPGVHPTSPPSRLQAAREAVSSRSGLFGVHVFKVRVDRSHFHNLG